MKLQLDENTLNAYINEAIRKELINESSFQVKFKEIGDPKYDGNINYKERMRMKEGSYGDETGYDYIPIGRAITHGTFRAMWNKDAVVAEKLLKALVSMGYSREQLASAIVNHYILRGTFRNNRFIEDKSQSSGREKLLSAYSKVFGSLRDIYKAENNAERGMEPEKPKQDAAKEQGETAGNGATDTTDKTGISKTYPWDAITVEDITAAEEKQKQERAEAWRRRNLEKSKAAQKMLQPQPETQPQQNAPAQPEAQAPARQEMPKISAPTQPSQVPAARVEYTPEKIKPAGNQSYVQSAIAQMTKAAQAGNNELKNKIGQTAINAISKYQPKNQQTQNDLSVIRNAMGNTLNEAALETDPEFAQDPLSVKKFQVWFNNTYGGQLVIDGKFGPKTRAAFKHWETYGTKNENKQNIRPTITEQIFKKLVKQIIAEEYMKRKK